MKENMETISAIASNPLIAVLLGLLVLVVMVYIAGMWDYRVLGSLNIPGAKPLPYVGNLLGVPKTGGIHLFMLEYMKKYGKVHSLCVGKTASIVIADPELLKQIMIKDFHNFTNHHRKFPSAKERKGLPRLDDADWKRVRSILSPTFTSGKLKLMVPAIEKSSKTLVDKLQDIADTGKIVDIFAWFSLMTLEVILATSFGVESPIQTEGTSNKFMIKARDLFKQPVMSVMTMLPFGSLWVSIILKFQNHFSFFAEVSRNILKSRKDQGVRGTKDILDIMLSAKNLDGTYKLTDDEMVGQAIAFLLAGHETSSNTLTMSAYYLALNPDIQDHLRSEILSARLANPDKPLYELVNELEYLECVVNEVQRMSPPAHTTNRACINTYKLNDTTTIPAGMEVLIPIYALHHDPQAWPDPEKFDPERFRGPAKESRHPFQFLPFGEGPRICIGKRFALLEIKITLVEILTKFKFVRCPETQIPLKMIAGITLTPKDGVFVRVESCI